MSVEVRDYVLRLENENFELKSRIEWALRVKRSGMVGFVPDMLHGNWAVLDTKLMPDSSFTLRSFVEACEREDKEDED